MNSITDNDDYKAAYDFFHQKNYKEAARKFKKISDLFPDNIDFYNDWGVCLFNIGNFKKLVEIFEKAAKFNGNLDSTFYNNWGIGLKNLKRFDEAEDKFRIAIEKNPNSTSAYYNWANLFYSKEEFVKACKKYELAVKNFDSSNSVTALEDIYLNWARALSYSGNNDEAIKKVEKAEKIDKQSAEILVLAGNIYFEKGDIHTALKKYISAARLSRISAEVRLSKNSAEVRLRRISAEARFRIGYVHNSLGNYQYAKRNFERAVRLAPESNTYLLYLADTYSIIGEYETALKSYKKALELEADQTDDFYLNWGVALFKLNKFDEAIVKYKKAIKINQDNCFALIYQGLCLEAQRLDSEAEQLYLTALKKEENNTEALFALGNFKYKFRDFDSARSYFERVLKISPKSHIALFNSGLCYWQLGKYNACWKNWDKARDYYATKDFQNTLVSQPEELYNYITILHNYLGENTYAEELLGRAKFPLSDPQFLLNKLYLFLELKESNSQTENIYHVKAHKTFKELENYFKTKETQHREEITGLSKKLAEANKSGSKDTLIAQLKNKKALEEYGLLETLYNLGTICYLTENFDGSLKLFNSAFEMSQKVNLPILSEIQNAIGTCYSQTGEHSKAIDYIKSALQENYTDFTIRNNLAFAYLKAFYNSDNNVSKTQYLDSAEIEYRKILRDAPNNIDAYIGLGNVLLELTEFSSQQRYEDVIEYFNTALELAKTGKGSRRLLKKERSAIFYSLGYAKIRLFEKSTAINKNKWLQAARRDFQRSYKEDIHNLQSVRAYEAIKQNKDALNNQSFLEKISSYLICLLAVVVFALTLSSYFFNYPKDDLSIGYFITLNFGSMLILIAGLSLPLLVKLKIGTIELEKKIKENIVHNEDFSTIKKQLLNVKFDQMGLWIIPKNKSTTDENKAFKIE